MRREIATVAAAAFALSASMVGPAFAEHPHHLDLPNENCADAGGQGFGTDQSHDDDTAFHNRVHKGTPGTHAFEQPNNPVSVAGERC